MGCEKEAPEGRIRQLIEQAEHPNVARFPKAAASSDIREVRRAGRTGFRAEKAAVWAADTEVIDLYLKGQKQAVRTVEGWIARAAYPYQKRLATHWDDVRQDILLEITRLLMQGKFRGESSFKTYLWRLVSHTCLDQIRAESRAKWTELAFPSKDETEQSVFPSSPVTEGPGSRAEIKDLLLRVLERVPAECRELWRMINAGLSYREMSARLAIAEATIRVRVLRCREKAVAIRAELLPKAPS